MKTKSFLNFPASKIIIYTRRYKSNKLLKQEQQKNAKVNKENFSVVMYNIQKENYSFCLWVLLFPVEMPILIELFHVFFSVRNISLHT